MMAPKANKPVMAVLAGPTRSFMAWAMVKTSKLSRPVRRFVILRSSHLSICATDNPRSQLMSVLVTGATMTLTSSRNECHFRAASHRIWVQWYSEPDLRACKSAFEFANRQIDSYFKLVTHRQLGKGRNSEVIFAFDTATGDHAAVKIINKDKARITDREYAEKEVRIRMTVQHPCIVQTLDIFESPYDLFVVMEHMPGGSLDRRLSKMTAPLPEWEARIIMRRLFTALDHLHERGIAHRNVKPENIYLDINDDRQWPCTTKLSGFSLACHLNDPDSTRQVVGTPEYLAPEASAMTRTADGERGVVFGTEVDMWAAGVTLYNMLSLELPFEGDFPPDVFKKARAGHVPVAKMLRGASPHALSLIRALLNVDRRKRPTTQTVMLHPWFAGTDAEPFEPGDDVGWVWPLRGYDHTEGLARFRAAATAVMVLARLGKRAPRNCVVRGRRRGVEKRFDSVMGVDIAPTEQRCASDFYGEARSEDEEFAHIARGRRLSGGVRSDDEGAWAEYAHEVVHGGHAGKTGKEVLRGRTSNTVISRVSTESTVKSRSSAGTDSVAGVMQLTMGGLRNKVLGVTDARALERRRATGSVSSAEGASEVQRLLMTQAAGPSHGGAGGRMSHGQPPPHHQHQQRLWRRWK